MHVNMLWKNTFLTTCILLQPIGRTLTLISLKEIFASRRKYLSCPKASLNLGVCHLFFTHSFPCFSPIYNCWTWEIHYNSVLERNSLPTRNFIKTCVSWAWLARAFYQWPSWLLVTDILLIYCKKNLSSLPIRPATSTSDFHPHCQAHLIWTSHAQAPIYTDNWERPRVGSQEMGNATLTK